MSTSAFGAYTLEEIEALENEHPELGRIEIVHGALYAGRLEVGSDTHMSIVFELTKLLASACPPGDVVRFETWWHLGLGQLLRPDLAVWADSDRPGEDEAFRLPPRAVVEVLSLDSDHDPRHQACDLPGPRRRHVVCRSTPPLRLVAQRRRRGAGQR